jgi:hypothetical protein
MYQPQFPQQQQPQQPQASVPHDNSFIDLVHLNDNRFANDIWSMTNHKPNFIEDKSQTTLFHASA